MLFEISYIILEGSGSFVPDSFNFGTDESQRMCPIIVIVHSDSKIRQETYKK